MKLIINKPEIKENRLISNIQYEDNSYNMYFEVENEYIKYLCSENNDAFLISLIPFIIKHNYDVKVNGKISSRIYYQLTNYLIPLLCKEFNKKVPKIECELADIKFETCGVGASISCGVDSFYTLLNHKGQADTLYNVTHLTFFNAGSHGEYGGDEARKLYNERLFNIRKFCEENNYKLVTVDSNMNELIMMNHEMTHTFRTLGCVLALQKLFGKYYFASGLEFNGSHIDERDTAYYDIMNVQCISNENVTFYCSGLEASRMEKIKYISDFEETYDWLNVCISHEWKNCGECSKCLRTMTELESIGKLDKYKNVFDLEKYKKNKYKAFIKIYKSLSDPITKSFYNEIFYEYKKNEITYPKSAKICALVPNKKDLKDFLKRILPKKIVDKIKNRKNKIKDGWTD